MSLATLPLLPAAPRGLRYGLLALLLTGIALANFHLSGRAPASVLLDPSWCQVLDAAATRDWVFGRDLMFTFGPFGYLHCDDGLGQHAGLRYAAALGLAFGFAYLLVRGALEAGPRLGWPLLLWGALLLDVEARAYLVIAFGAVVLLWRRDGPWAALLVTALLALLSLVKFSFFVPAAFAVAVITLTLASGRQLRAAALVAGSYLGLLLALWLAAGQPLGALPGYLAGSLDMSGGYAGAMSYLPRMIQPNPLLLLLVLAIWGALVGLLGLALCGTQARERHALLLIDACLIYVAWKRGFVRADALHLIGFFAILPVLGVLPMLGAMLWRASLQRWGEACCGLLALIALAGIFAIDRYHPVRQIDDMRAGMRALLAGPQPGPVPAGDPKTRGTPGPADRLLLTQRLAGRGSVDLISYEQGRLFFNDLNYRPRPVIQSYAAYTPALAARNAAHFLGPQRPDFVLFNPAETIDGRLPMMDDGAALLVVLGNYRALGRDGKYLLLQRRDDAPRPPQLESLAERELHWGEDFDLTAFRGEVLAFALEVTPSAAGRLAGLLFQSLPPQIVLDAGDGERRYRLVPGMLATPVLLSPHLRTSEDLLALGAPPPAAGFGHAVRRLRFEVAPPAPLLAGHEDFGRALYHDTLKLRLYRVRGLPDAGFTAAYSPDPDRVRAGP
ncbi:MAG TPA: hypothetical protein PK144_06685 [Plasticicumulans sp.]|nr:hypothetical protein [Plasticicumulans sp.]